MPGIGGLVTLDRVMALRPTPVIILSTHAGRGAPQTIEALHRGAADFIDKQEYSLLDFSALREVLVAKVLAVAWSDVSRHGTGTLAPAAPEPAGGYQVLLIGASTGGPPAIEQVLQDLGGDCPVPVLVVQHMPQGFTRAFADRLNSHLPLEVREAEEGMPLLPGRVYIAPGGPPPAHRPRRRASRLQAVAQAGRAGTPPGGGRALPLGAARCRPRRRRAAHRHGP